MTMESHQINADSSQDISSVFGQAYQAYQNRRRQWEEIKWKFQYPESETEENSENKIKFLKIPWEASWMFPYRERRAR